MREHRALGAANRQTGDSMVKGSAIILFGRTIGKGFRFLVEFFLARGLGSSLYGLYSLGYSIFLIVSQVALLGFQNGIVRYIAIFRKKDENRGIKGVLLTSYAVSLSGSIVLSAVLWISSDAISIHVFGKPVLSLCIRAFAVALPFFSLIVLSQFVARAFQNMRYEVLIWNLAYDGLYMVVVGCLFWVGVRLYGYLAAFVLVCCMTAGCGLYLTYRLFPPLFSSLRARYRRKELFSFSIPTFISEFAVTFLTRIDRLIIGYFLFSSQVGIYNVAAVIAAQLFMIFNAVNTNLSPRFAILGQSSDREVLQHLFARSIRWVFGIMFAAGLVMLTIPREILALFGSDFVDGETAFKILIASRLIASLLGPAGMLLQMSGYQYVVMVNNLMLVGLVSVSGYFFVQWWGITGAAIASAGSMVLDRVIKLFEVIYFLRIRPYNWSIIRLLGVSGFSLIIVYFLGIWEISLILKCFSGTLIYLVLLFSFGLEDEDVRVIGNIKNEVFSGLIFGRRS